MKLFGRIVRLSWTFLRYVARTWNKKQSIIGSLHVCVRVCVCGTTPISWISQQYPSEHGGGIIGLFGSKEGPPPLLLSPINCCRATLTATLTLAATQLRPRGGWVYIHTHTHTHTCVSVCAGLVPFWKQCTCCALRMFVQNEQLNEWQKERALAKRVEDERKTERERARTRVVDVCARCYLLGSYCRPAVSKS